MKLQTANRLFPETVVKMLFVTRRFTINNFIALKLPKFIIIGLLLLIVGVGTVNAVQKTWDGSSSMNWNTAANWTPSGVPTSSDNVIIPNNFNVTVNTAAVCASFTINAGNKNNLIAISSGQSLTVSGAVTIGAGTGGAADKAIIVGNGTLTAGSVTMANNASNSEDSYISVLTGTVNVLGNITMNGSADRNQIAFLGAGTLNIGGNGTITGGTISNDRWSAVALTRGTVNYNGSTQTVGNYNYYHLTLSGSNAKTLQTGTTSIGGSLTLSGTASTTTVVGTTIGGDLNIGDGTTLDIGSNSLTVTGTTTIGGGTSGNLMISGYNASRIFTGLVTINTGGTWNNSVSSPVTFRGGITNNGTFTAGDTYTYTFDTNAQSLNGNLNMSGSTVVVTGINLTNYGTLTLGSALNGTGALINSSSGTLNIEGSGYINIATLTNQGAFTVTSSGGFGTSAANFTNTGVIHLNGSGYLTGLTNNANGTVNFINAGHTIGTFTNATSTSVLNISALITSASAINTLTATAAGNTVNYSGLGDQTIKNITYSNLTVSGSGTKTLSGGTTVTGILTLTNGVLSTTTDNLLSITNSATSAISGGSATAYINGPVKWTLPASLASGSTYVFPVGKAGSYKPFSLVNPTTGTGVTTVQVEAFATNSGGSPDATMESISTEDYWQITENGTLTNTSVSLGRATAIAPMNTIASGASVNGTYTAYNGTVGTTEITNSATIPITGNTSLFFVLGRISPKITVSLTSLSGFAYAENNGPSTEQSFAVSGTNMTENIRLSLPADSKFELSTESGGFFLGSVNALLINNGSGNVPSTTIYVRLKAGISAGTYSDIITASSTGATNRTITVSGTVANQPQIIVTPGALTGMSYVLGFGPSTPAQTFIVKGTSIVGDVTVTAPADFEISRTSATTGFTSTSFTITKAEVEVTAGKTVWVRLKSGLSTSTYNQDITLTATYATDVTVNCQGTVNRATINVSEFTLAGFIYTSGTGPSEVQTFNVSGYALSSNIVITAPTHFAISTSLGGTYGSSITLTQTSGVVNSTPIYVRMKSGYSVGVIAAENILLTSTNAITQSVACSGAVVSGSATISSYPNLNGFFYVVGQGPSVVQWFTVSATGLGGNDVAVTAPADFEISSSGTEGSFVNNFTIAPNSGKINAYRVYIRLKAGKLVNSYNGNVTLTSSVTTSVNVACSGKVVALPTITAGPSNPLITCAGSNVTLTSTGTNIINQSWSGPNNFYSTATNPNLGPGTTALNGNYTVTGTVGSGVNLLTNGDFESGNIGFGSTYAYNTGTYGRYVITDNPSNVDATYFINGTDHTPTPGTKMMVVDGAETTGAIIWSQTIAVNSNTTYQLSYYAENINKTGTANFAKLQLYVNNVPVGPINTLSATTWSQYLCNVNSGASTSLQMTLINTFIGGDGNDFGLDDMVFEQVFQVSSTLPLTVSPQVTPSVVIAASSNPSTTGAAVTFTATPTNGGTVPTYAWYVNSVLQVGTDATFSYVPQNSDQVKCVLTSSLQCTTANPVNSTNTITMVVNPSTNYWRGTSSTNWGTASNWTGNFVPIPGADVVFATVQNYGSAAVNDLVLDQNRTQGSLINQTTKRLVIPAGKTLTINNNITTDGNTSRVHIEASSTSPNGSLIYYGNSAVYATVEMYSKSSWDVTKTNPKQRYNWQYFGIPVDTIKANPTFYGGYIRERNEAGNDTLTHWQSLTNESNVIPFKGYELCYETPRLIAFKGKLVNRNYNSGPLSKTTSNGVLYAGQYIFANPYTAAIDILQLGLGSDMEQQIYLYNTGTFEQWSAVKVSGQIGNAPGQYTAVPKSLAGVNLIPRQLPSMGSMLVRVADPTSNAYVSINYNSVAMGNTDMQRAPSEQMRYNGMSTRFDIEGKTSTDRMWLVANEKFTRSYDDGYDGEKIPGSALDPQIYVIEEDGNYQVGAVDDLNNTTLAFQAGQDTEYKMTVVHENAEGKYSKIYLVDIVANVATDITESGTEYNFTAASTAKPVSRFKIISNSAADGVVNSTHIKVFTMNNNICVYNDTKLEAKVSVYDLAGRNCGYKTVSTNGIITFPVQLQQAYIVKAVTDTLSESTKILIK